MKIMEEMINEFRDQFSHVCDENAKHPSLEKKTFEECALWLKSECAKDSKKHKKNKTTKK